MKKSSVAFGMTRIFLWGTRISYCFFWTRITRITRIFLLAYGSHRPHESLFAAVRSHEEHEIRRRPTDRREVIMRMTRIFFCTRISPIARMLVRVGTLTWRLLNENDTNEINTDSTRSFVNTHYSLCLVLKIESLYSFSPTIGKKAFIVLTYRKSFILFLAMAKFKQACFSHNLSKKFQIFTAVHNSMLKIQQRIDFFLI